MTTVKFEILSDESYLFNADSLSHADQHLNYNVTQYQLSTIILRINQRIKEYKSPRKFLCFIGLLIIITSVITLVIVMILGTIAHFIQALARTLHWNEDSALYLEIGFVVFATCFMIGCCGACSPASEKYYRETRKKQFRQLQSDIQKIADKKLIGIPGILSSKWILEKLGDRIPGKKLKLTVEFRLSQERIAPVPVRSVREPIDSTSIQLDLPTRISAASTLGIDLEQVTTSLHNEQDSQYVIVPVTPSPPSYHKAIDLFSEGIFGYCPHCRSEKGVFSGKYCTLCGHSF